MRKLKDYCYCVYMVKTNKDGKRILELNKGAFDSLKEVGDYLGIKGDYLRSYISRKDLIKGLYEVVKVDLSFED